MGKLNTIQNGKGSKKRPTNIKKFNDNYDNIDWTKTTEEQKNLKK